MELEYLVNFCVIYNLIERAHLKQGLQIVHMNLYISKYINIHSVHVWVESTTSCMLDKHSTTVLHSQLRMLRHNRSIMEKSGKLSSITMSRQTYTISFQHASS